MQTRPHSVIQLLSKAYLRKKAAAKTNTMTASQPIRLPIHHSTRAASDGCERVPEGKIVGSAAAAFGERSTVVPAPDRQAVP